MSREEQREELLKELQEDEDWMRSHPFNGDIRRVHSMLRAQSKALRYLLTPANTAALVAKAVRDAGSNL